MIYLTIYNVIFLVIVTSQKIYNVFGSLWEMDDSAGVTTMLYDSLIVSNWQMLLQTECVIMARCLVTHFPYVRYAGCPALDVLG